MHEEIFRALQEGATIITASRRLARVLASDFHSMEAERGHTVWNRPDVLPLDAYLDRTWGEWLGRWADENAPVLLDAAQEQMLWEQIIRESPDGASLLQIPETARQGVETWRLIAEYRLPVDGSFEASEDWAAFAGLVARVSAAMQAESLVGERASQRFSAGEDCRWRSAPSHRGLSSPASMR